MSRADHDQHRRDIDGIHNNLALLDGGLCKAPWLDDGLLAAIDEALEIANELETGK